MTTSLGALLLVVGFVATFLLLRLTQHARNVTAIAWEALALVRSAEVPEEVKERRMQAYAVRLFGLFLTLTLGGAAAILLPLALVWLLDQVGFLQVDEVLKLVVSVEFIVGTTLVGLLAMWLMRFVRRDANRRYSFVDRLVHRIAFHSRSAQISIADMEDRQLRQALASLEAAHPVFITALPRAGTTMLLECLANLDDFASHRYRDMPFVMIPRFWSRMSQRHQAAGAARERAHADGVMVDADSPEALEEVLWKFFWKSHYLPDRIRPWSRRRDGEFEEFFRAHQKKIILVRKGTNAPHARYVSKNNANISRLALLRAMFDNCSILVPFREPLQHVISLRRQHENFLRQQREDAFVLEYMTGIGHFDFGMALRPIDFEGWIDRAQHRDALSLNFWLEYWIAAYRHVLASKEEGLHLIAYERLCQDPVAALGQVADWIDIVDRQRLQENARAIRSSKPRQPDAAGLDDSLLEEARQLYQQLLYEMPVASA